MRSTSKSSGSGSINCCWSGSGGGGGGRAVGRQEHGGSCRSSRRHNVQRGVHGAWPVIMRCKDWCGKISLGVYVGRLIELWVKVAELVIGWVRHLLEIRVLCKRMSRVGVTRVKRVGALRLLNMRCVLHLRMVLLLKAWVWGCIGDWRRAVLTLVVVNVKESTASRALPAGQISLVNLVLLASLRLRRMKSGAVHLIHLFHLNTEVHDSGSSVSPYHSSCRGISLLLSKAFKNVWTWIKMNLNVICQTGVVVPCDWKLKLLTQISP